MRPSNRQRRIRIENKVSAISGSGYDNGTWTNLLTCWAEVYYGSGNERTAAQQLSDEQTADFIVRYQDVLVSRNLRIELDGEWWNVVATQPVGRRENLRLKATRDIAQTINE